MKLDHALWVGGSTCAGKSAVASRIALTRGAVLYAVDQQEPKSAEELDAERYPACARWMALSLDKRWARSSPAQLVEDTLVLCHEIFELVVEDVRKERVPVVVEGFQLLPELVAGIVPTVRHAVFLVATPEFRRATHFSRPHAWTMPSQTSDPEVAQRNRLERDDRLGEHIFRTARKHGLKAIMVDGTRSIDEVTMEAEAHIAEASRG